MKVYFSFDETWDVIIVTVETCEFDGEGYYPCWEDYEVDTIGMDGVEE